MRDSGTRIIDALGTANARLGELLYRANGSGQFVYDQQAAFFMLGERSTAIQARLGNDYDALVAACADAATGARIAGHTVRLDEIAAELEGFMGGPAPRPRVAAFVVSCAGALDATAESLMQVLRRA